MNAAYPLRSEQVCVVVVREENTAVDGEREKMPFCCLGPIDCEGTMERGNEVGSGYANACLLEDTDIQLSTRDIKQCIVISPFKWTIRPSSTFYPFVIIRDVTGRKSSRYVPP